MSDLYKNKFRISSTRLQNWNYANEAMYFVTICTKDMECFFGEIVEMQNTKVSSFVDTPCMAYLQEVPQTSLQPTEIGKVALSEWYKSVEIRPDMNISLDEFTVMPNHIHGIICIGKNEFNSLGSMNKTGRDAMHGVSTAISKSVEYKNQFGPQSKNLSSIIRGYKSAVTTFARKENQYFEWQERFHDHVIRSKEEYIKISNYIKNNPSNWQKDKFNPLNIMPS